MSSAAKAIKMRLLAKSVSSIERKMYPVLASAGLSGTAGGRDCKSKKYDQSYYQHVKVLPQVVFVNGATPPVVAAFGARPTFANRLSDLLFITTICDAYHRHRTRRARQ